MTLPCTLLVNDLRVWVHLGCSEAEKYNPQLVSFNIEFTFDISPVGTITDNLDDTVCYLQITEAVQSLCQSKNFNLIEHLAYEIYRLIINFLSQNSKKISNLSVTVHKLAPPAPGIHGGVKFIYTEKIA